MTFFIKAYILLPELNMHVNVLVDIVRDFL